MATILTLQPRLEKVENNQRKRPDARQAHVIFFPGVRYERMPDASARSSKANKKTLKTA